MAYDTTILDLILAEEFPQANAALMAGHPVAFLDTIGAAVEHVLGVSGTSGADGRTLLNGAGVPSGALGADGDFYVNTSATTIYGPKTAGAWGSPTSLIGPAGTNGTNGATWTSGTAVPSGGVNGNYYLRTSNGDVYLRSSGTWSVVANLVGPTGPTGANGATWTSGTAVPSGGANGDYYFRTSTGDVYLRTAGTWSIISNLTGPTGPAGSGGSGGTLLTWSSVYSSTTPLAVAASTDTALLFDSEAADTSSFHSVVSNTSRFTIPATGAYSIVANVVWEALSSGDRRVSIRLNGTTVIARASGKGLASSTFGTPCVFSGTLTAGDYVEVVVHSTSATGVVGGLRETSFTIIAQPPDPAGVIYIDATNGRAGVGTATPAVKFQVYETTNGSVEGRVTNPNTGTSAQATERIESDAVNLLAIAYSSTNSGTRMGLPRANRAAVVLTTGTGLFVGTLAGPVFLGANDVEQLKLDTGLLAVTASDLRVATVGKGLQIAQGSNAKAGVVTLVAGTATVSTTAVTASSYFLYNAQNVSGTAGQLSISAKTVGTSFVITSTSAADTRQIFWMIVES